VVRRLSRPRRRRSQRQHHAGNKKGGLSNIVEKAMGSIIKSGTAPITGVLSPASRCATAASRAGSSTPRRRRATSSAARCRSPRASTSTSSPPAAARPMAGRGSGDQGRTRSELARRWHDLMDVNAGRIADGTATIERWAGSSSASCSMWPAAGRRPGPSMEAAQPLVLFNPHRYLSLIGRISGPNLTLVACPPRPGYSGRTKSRLRGDMDERKLRQLVGRVRAGG
jgi:hypothetical protein